MLVLLPCLQQCGAVDRGIGVNPARCMGLMVAKSQLQYHYIHWLADLAACITNGLFYYFIPPYVTRRSR